MATKRDEDIRPGDVTVFLGTPRRVARVSPYVGPLQGTDGWRIAEAEPATGSTYRWRMTLIPGQTTEMA
jgi:hypothetical protein